MSTKPKPTRRKLHFDSIPQTLAEADRLAALERSNTAQYAGNWTVGQILNHCAASAEYAFTGIPVNIPWYIKLLARPLKHRFLAKGLPAGARFPKIPGGTFAIEPAPADQALARFKAAYTHLENECPPGRHPIFGPMTHAQWIAFNLRHAELHMSFVIN